MAPSTHLYLSRSPSQPFHFTLHQRPLQSATATAPPTASPPSPTAGEEFGLIAAAAAAATMDAAPGPSSRVTILCSVGDIFSDFRARRSAIVRALTEDLEKFAALCNPGLDCLCLYGNSDGTWEVAPPPELVPPELPEPALGINIPRDTLYRSDWVALLAVFTDSWLLAVAFFHGASLDRDDRVRLFNMINDLPTVYEVVFGVKQSGEQSGMDNGAKDTPSLQVENIAEAKAHEVYGEVPEEKR